MSGGIPYNATPDRSAQGEPGAFPTSAAHDSPASMDPNNPAGMGLVVNSDTQQSALAPPPPLTPDA
jgi:hypothetical protein